MWKRTTALIVKGSLSSFQTLYSVTTHSSYVKSLLKQQLYFDQSFKIYL